MVQELRKKLKLSGWVRNLSDSRVELLVSSGGQADLVALERALLKGSLFASVESVQHSTLELGTIGEDVLTTGAEFAILATSDSPLVPALKL